MHWMSVREISDRFGTKNGGVRHPTVVKEPPLEELLRQLEEQKQTGEIRRRC